MAKLDLINPSQIPIDKFLGLFDRGSEDGVPPGYFIDALNINLNDADHIGTRYGSTKVFTIPNVRRAFLYKRLNETSRYLVLDSSGNFFDSLYYPTPLITNAAFIDFSVVNLNNRAYVTFHSRVIGVGAGVYVYQGDGTIRLAAGTKPNSFVLSVADSASAGDIEVGTHLFAVAFETDSGFITPPGPDVWTVYNAPGGLSADISNIPIGPAGTAARWILVSQTQPDYDGNQDAVELFFLHRIGNNSATTATVNFFDGNLNDSADYLNDLLETIPAGTFIFGYLTRLVIGGVSGHPHEAYASLDNDPESFDSVDSLILVKPQDSQSSVTNGLEFRNSLILFKGRRAYITQGTSDAPKDWQVDSLDNAIGTQCFGVAPFIDDKGGNTERFFVADPAGIFVFESGVFRRPNFSYNIESIWQRINKTYFNKVQLALDATNEVLYAAVPLDSATEISHLLVAFFSNTVGPYGFIVPTKVRWMIYDFPYDTDSILIDQNATGDTVFKFASQTGNIYQMNVSGYLDDSQQIQSYIKTALYTKNPGWVNQYQYIHFRILGSGAADLILQNQDNTITQTISDFLTLDTAPGREYGRKINFVSEKMAIKIGTFNNAGDYFKLVQMILHSTPLWAQRVE